MKLLTKAILNKIPAIYGQDGKGNDARIYAKFFDIMSNARWYITELDQDEQAGMAFGFVNLYGNVNDGCAELGYINLEELEEMNERFPRIERDRSWDDKNTIGMVKAGEVY